MATAEELFGTSSSDEGGSDAEESLSWMHGMSDADEWFGDPSIWSFPNKENKPAPWVVCDLARPCSSHMDAVRFTPAWGVSAPFATLVPLVSTGKPAFLPALR